MAQKVQVVLIDDLDGSEASQTIGFGLDGSTYEIDLTEAHARELRDALATWVAHARKVSGSARAGGAGRATTPRRSKARVDAAQLQEIRRWAKENGHEIKDRGRISQDIQDAYQAAHAAG